jgi:UDP-N-acetylmuramoyl-tripeptide--D-alanyl-D-alanine ligase
MQFWQVLVPIYLLTLIIQFSKWLWLWQKKDYRLDKMKDYLTLPESRSIVFDYWLKMRIIALLYMVLEYIFSLDAMWISYVFIALWVVEIGIFIHKLVTNKNVLIPTFTRKAQIISMIGVIVSICIVLISQTHLSNSWGVFVLTLSIVLAPLHVALCILLVLPLDYYAKQKLYTQAKIYRSSLKYLSVIGISGAFGKTTTKEFLGHVLSKKFTVESTQKNQNTDISCARKTLNLLKNTDYFVCEIGAINLGDGDRTSSIIQPRCSIITGLNEQHYGLFGSIKNIITAETESLKYLQKGDLAIVNWSSEMCHQIRFPSGIKVIKCGINIDADYTAQNIKYDGKVTHFTLVHNNKRYQLSINLFSHAAVQNILHVIAFCVENQLWSLDQIQEYISDLPNPEGRLEVTETGFGTVIFNQYNNYDGIINILDFVSDSHNLIVFLDDIVELGDKSIEIHTKLGKKIAEYSPEKVILLGRNFSEIVQDQLIESGLDPKTITRWTGKNTSEISTDISEYQEENPQSTTLLLGYLSKNFR